MKTPLPILALILAVLSVLGVLSGCEKAPADDTLQPVALVNKGQVTQQQLQAVLQQRGLRVDTVDHNSRALLERLIDQELALQKAAELQLERDARIAQQLEALRRELLARAYLDKIGDAAVKPTAAEVRQFYETRPHAFAKRRIYSLQEVLIDARSDQAESLRQKLAELGNAQAFVEYLRASNLRFAINTAVRGADQLPLPVQEALAGLGEGQGTLVQAGNAMQMLMVAAVRDQPMSEEQARPMIEQIILAERRRALQEEEVKALRAQAKITYMGSYAAAAGTAAPAAPGSAAK